MIFRRWRLFYDDRERCWLIGQFWFDSPIIILLYQYIFQFAGIQAKMRTSFHRLLAFGYMGVEDGRY